MDSRAGVSQPPGVINRVLLLLIPGDPSSGDKLLEADLLHTGDRWFWGVWVLSVIFPSLIFMANGFIAFTLSRLGIY